jgi:hypothetical protein
MGFHYDVAVIDPGSGESAPALRAIERSSKARVAGSVVRRA